MKFYHQIGVTDCGPTCIRMIASQYGKEYSLEEIRKRCEITRTGVSFSDLIQGSEKLGLKAMGVKITVDNLKSDVPYPLILHWNHDHFVVLEKIKNNVYYILDPGHGKLKLKEEEFLKFWKTTEGKGIALLLQPTEKFFDVEPEKVENGTKRGLQFLKSYYKTYKKPIVKLVAILGVTSVLAFIFPMTIQYLLDEGVQKKKLNIVWVVLLFQSLLFLGQVVFEWFRGVLLIKLGVTVSLKIITDFLYKIIKLPIKFFDTRLYTDILQRIDEQNKIERFLNHIMIQSIFTFFLIVALSIQLAILNTTVFIVFLVLSLLSVGWMLFFNKKRERLNYIAFNNELENRNALIELITGMTEVKINNAQAVKVSAWKKIQYKLHDIKLQGLRIDQFQEVGMRGFNHIKSILITFICAYWVINQSMTLGVMLSVGYILGQLTNSFETVVDFVRALQEAKISFDRMDEVHQKEDENKPLMIKPNGLKNKIALKGVSFKYEGSNAPYILKDIDLEIPVGSVTAIVGVSGSGKTTLMKLLLKFYQPTEGRINLDNLDFKDVNADDWRDQCGVVLQDGHIFSGTIAENIALSDEEPDMKRLEFAAKTACIYDFIQRLPLKFDTKIGNTGLELSGGQKQRLFIARAVYKNPEYIFLDEATSALDANNESMIMDNLNQFFKGKTVFVIAHRLSTVKNADQILVLEDGKVIEQGNHKVLVKNKHKYFNLVKNQLELGA
ncbi:peptidase domain-containing ABC transporter [Tenacibaculum sp. Ill]|uniref:peptidase domain-containing ABC transporter n=1 Tax=Tenacibaculum sp. Ill TaxID=3445935 RepID=UPI003F7AADBF